MMGERAPRPLVAAIGLAAAFVALAAYYSVVTPIFEAPDELWHYLVVADLAHGRLADPNGPARQEATQPPLYYALGAVLWRLAPAPSPDAVLPLNPYFDWRPGNATNLNFAYHGAGWESFPFAGLARTVHLLRLLSVSLGALTVLGAFALARLVAPGRTRVAFLTAGFVVLLPQFLFLSGAINNDLAVVAACTWTMVLLVRWERGMGGEALLSLTLGLAVLSKATAIGLALVVAGALLRDAPRGEPLARRVGRIVLVLGGAFLVGGWWYLRLGVLYRDPLGTAARDVALGRTTPFTLGEAIGDLGQLGLTFVARFGQTNLAPPLGVSLAYLAVVGGGLLLGVRAAVRERRPVASLQLAWIGVILVLFYIWQLSVPGPQGRLVFPALASIAVVWALGVDDAIRRAPVAGEESASGRRQASPGGASPPGPLSTAARRGGGHPSGRRAPSVGDRGGSRGMVHPPAALGAAPVALGVAALVGAIAFPALLIGPAYRPRPDRLLARLPPTARAASMSFGEEVNLVGYEGPDDAASGTLRLFWRRGPRPDGGVSFFVHAVDPAGRVVSSADSALAPSIPLLAWPAGSTVEVDVTLRPPPPAGSTERLDVGTYRIVGGAIRAVPVGAGEASSQTLEVLQPGAAPRAGDVPAVARFGPAGGDAVDLLGWSLDAGTVRPGGRLAGHLLWSAPGPVRLDYTVFVHVVRAGKLVAQYDAPPVGGFFPTTAWPPNVVVRDAFAVPIPDDLPGGPAQVVLGLYDAKTMRRLPLPRGDSLILTTIDVRE